MATQTPHDALFKRAFSDPEQAASLLRFELPPAVSARIDWSSLKVVPGSFVDETLLDLVSLDAPRRTELEPYLPKFRFLLDDLATESDDALGHRALEVFAGLSLRALARLPQSPDPVAELQRWLPQLKKMLAAASGLQRLQVILEYLHCVTEAELNELRQVVAKLGPDAEEVLVTTAQKLIDQGKAEGQLDVVLRLLVLRFGPLSVEQEARVRAGTPDDFARWAERVLVATTLDEVFDAPVEGSRRSE